MANCVYKLAVTATSSGKSMVQKIVHQVLPPARHRAAVATAVIDRAAVPSRLDGSAPNAMICRATSVKWLRWFLARTCFTLTLTSLYLSNVAEAKEKPRQITFPSYIIHTRRLWLSSAAAVSLNRQQHSVSRPCHLCTCYGRAGTNISRRLATINVTRTEYTEVEWVIKAQMLRR